MGTKDTNYVIISDASADVDLETARVGGIKIIPMGYSLGDEMKTFSGFLSSSDYLDFYYSQRQGDLTKTTEISQEEYEKYFRSYAKQGISVLYISLSSGLSVSYDAAMNARRQIMTEYPDVQICVVDSLCATGGMGVYIETALRKKAEGLTLEENCQYLNMLHGHVHIWFFVQDLDYLKRGGRISGLKSLFGKMMKVKPILMLDEMGQIVSYKNARGLDNAKDMIFELFKMHYDNSDDPIYIVDGDNESDAADVAEMISRFNPRGEIRRRTLTPIIGAHTGPGMIAICHSGKKLQVKANKK
ncbi:MAG: DegV family protein [Ruminococcus sp.]|nr:DegV family protein [Ruminococcus sp.]